MVGLQYAYWRSGAVFLSAQSLLAHVATLAALRLFWGCFCRGRGGSGAHGDSGVGGGATPSHGPLLREESVLFIPGVGLQLESGLARPSSSSSGSSHSGPGGCAGEQAPVCVQRRARQLVELSCVRSVLINEGVQGGLFCFYLLLLLDGDEDAAAAPGGRSASGEPSARQRIVLPFRDLRPRLPVLKQIYAGLNDSLNSGP